MRSFVNEIASYLSLEVHITENILISLLIIFFSIIIRIILVGILSKRLADVKEKYYWIRAGKYFISILSFILLLFVWGSEFQSFATFFGLIAAALTIALKDLFVNMSGWIFILTRKPFQLGDRIQVGEHRGDVIDIRIFQFTINEIGNWVDADQSTGRIIHIPNGRVFTEPQANFSQGFSHIWHEINVLITFESDWKKTKEILTEIVNVHAPALSKEAKKTLVEASKKYMIIYNQLTPIVYTKVKDSGVQLSMRFLIKPQRRRGAEEAIWEDVLDTFAKHDNINLAYPTQRIYYEAQNSNQENPLS
ncbi:MAG: mechanosensitive ion channel family protein [Bacteroidetes bacterium]|nr:MAG: mechanosensitive ion channel family protein [Bacteroidota bacterium]